MGNDPLFSSSSPLSDGIICDILSSNRRIAVVGMSCDPLKAAHRVPKYLSEHGYDIIPVNPNRTNILDKKCYSSISGVPDTAVDIVNIFRPSDHVLPVVQEAIKKRPNAIWLQKGIHNSKAQQLASKAKIRFVSNLCMMEEHGRLLL